MPNSSSRTHRSHRSTRKPNERAMPTRPRINIALSHEAFTRATQPAAHGDVR